MHRAVCVLLFALLATPATADAVPSRDTRRVVTKMTVASLDLVRAREAAQPAAQAAADPVRASARLCLDELSAVPTERREALFGVYFNGVASALFTIDRPLFARWSRRLDAVRTPRADLRRMRGNIRGQFRLVDRIFGIGGDVCASAREWSSTGFDPARPPTAISALQRIFETDDFPRVRVPNIVRRTPAGRAASEILKDGLDEEDSLVYDEDDPVAMLLNG